MNKVKTSRILALARIGRAGKLGNRCCYVCVRRRPHLCSTVRNVARSV